MKKLQLLVLCSVAFLSVSAQSKIILDAPAKANGPARAATEKFNIQFCGNEVGGWIGYTPDDAEKITCYLHIPAERATQLAGNKITGLTLSVCVGADAATNRDNTAKGTVFVSEDMTQPPLIQMNMTYRNAFFLEGYQQTAQFSKKNQYEIKAGQEFYFGFTVNVSDFILLGFDKLQAHDQFSGEILLDLPNGSQTLQSGSEIFMGQDNLMHNLFLYAMTEGSVVDSDNFSVGNFKIGDWPEPAFDKEHLRPMLLELENTGTTDITTIDYSYWFETDQTPRQATAAVSLAAGAKDWVALPIDYIEGRSTLYVRVEKINGVGLSHLGKADFFYLGEKGFPGKFVVEKLTGQDCGYCPQGIWGFQKMMELYPEDFVPVAIMNYSSNPYYCYEYYDFVVGLNAAPQCDVNRMPDFHQLTPRWKYLEAAYEIWNHQMSNGDIELSVSTSGNSINVTSNTTFAIDDTHSYALCYVLLEDGLTGFQANNYAGMSDSQSNYETVGDWTQKGSRAPWVYEHVARSVRGALGLEDSYISFPRGGETYTCSTSFFTNAVYSGDLSKAYVQAMLIDKTNGVIVTAKTAAVVPGGHDGTGIETATSSSAPEYYNLQGVRIQTPQKGQKVVRVKDGKATKMIF